MKNIEKLLKIQFLSLYQYHLMLLNWDCPEKAEPELCRNAKIQKFLSLNFQGFLSFFCFRVWRLAWGFWCFLFVVFKSRDTAFIQTVLTLEVKTSILRKTLSFWLLFDFWGGQGGFVFVCFVVFVFFLFGYIPLQ